MQPATTGEDPASVGGRWLPLVVVVVVIALVVGGGQLFSRAVTSTRGPVDVGAVEIRPRPGWDVESITTSPAAARLHRGAVVLDVLASPADATGPASIAVRYVQQRLRPALSQLLPSGPEPAVLAGGTPAARIGYVGMTADGLPVEGVVTAVAGASSSAIFDAAAPRGELIGVADDIQAMIDGAVVP
jgi:hypothetical protein